MIKAAILLLSLSLLLTGAGAPKERRFSFEYSVTVKDIPAGTKTVEIWLPQPHDDPYQRISNLRVTAPFPHTTSQDALGNTILHMQVNDPSETSIAVTLKFDAARKEHIQSVLASYHSGAEESPAELARWLKPDRLVPLDAKIHGWAQEVVDQAHAKTDLDMARAIYDHVVSTVKYDKSGKGWGNGDIYYACDARRGNCTDFHAIFIGYARSLGIPARFAIGFPLPADRGVGKIAGYHCWAEFYANGIGWVPVDASEAAKNPARREYFFGAHDENRVEFSRGRDIVLAPRQQGDPLNYFIYPYVEVNGAKYTSLETAYSYQDLPAGALRASN